MATTLVHAYGYEERSVKGVVDALANEEIDRVLSVLYTDTPSPLIPAWRSNRQRIDTTVAAHGLPQEVISITTDSQIHFEQAVRTALSNDRMVLDISCLTHLHILLILPLVRSEDRVRYVAALEHSLPGADERSRHSGCISVLGYEGHFSTAAPNLAVLIAGFEGQRSLASYLELEPQRAVAIFGVPWIAPEDAARYLNMAVSGNDALLAHHNVRSAIAPSLSPREFAVRLHDIVAEHVGGFRNEWNLSPNVIVIPMGTKLQTVGLHAYCRGNPATKVLYAARSQRSRIASGAGPVFSYAGSDILDDKIGIGEIRASVA